MTSGSPRRVRGPGRRRLAGLRDESGNALIEFVFLGILAMVPLVYLVVAVSTVQRNAFAVTQAAREAGRAYATADTEDQGAARARYAVQLALADQGVSTADVTVSYVPASAACGPPEVIRRPCSQARSSPSACSAASPCLACHRCSTRTATP